MLTGDFDNRIVKKLCEKEINKYSKRYGPRNNYFTVVLLLSSDNGCGFPCTERRGIFQVTGRAAVILSVLILGAMRTQHGKSRWDSLWWDGAGTPRWVRGTPSNTQDCSHQGLAIKPRTTPAHGKAYSRKNFHLTSGSRFCFPTICLFYIYCTVKTEMH